MNIIFDVRIFSRNFARPPQYLGENSSVKNSLVSEGCRIYGTVINSVLSGGVIVEEGAVIKDSVVMEDVVVKCGGKIYTAIVDSDVVVEQGAVIGKSDADKSEITVVAKGSVITADASANN